MRNSLYIFLIFIQVSIISCKNNPKVASADAVSEIKLKKGNLISCSPGEQRLGTLDFKINAPNEIQDAFNTGVKLLHSFEYDEAEKVFAGILDKDPQCAMAWWGVAMSNFHPLWTPPTEAELIKGNKVVEIAAAKATEQKEKDYINAVAGFFSGWQQADHRTRTLKFEKGMQSVYEKYPGDIEAAIFYALSLDAAADPADKTFSNQKKAAAILNPLYVKYPDHPGIVHYIIHSFDSPELAANALTAARRYTQVAPSSAHALHMPSHIFTRLGLWRECINSNLQSVASAKCYAEAADMPGHWDEELHSLDYLTYAYLQSGQPDSARLQWDYINSMKMVTPVNFKVAYAFASIPSRYLVENKLWKEAAMITSGPSFINWNEYPWQHAILFFTRALGNLHTGNLPAAKTEIDSLKSQYDRLTQQKDTYKANQVLIQVNSAEAWLKFKQGNNGEALEQMKLAADMEDKTEKHPVTPCEVIPARELLADMLLEMHQPEKALINYEMDLAKHPNRLNTMAGAARAANQSGNKAAAKKYYNLVINGMAKETNSELLTEAKKYLN